ncbi:dodecin family protein [Henriciella litoralis]|uniref:dodecin family protein n=1 Tax=Henriciella litoralis TaxID=568102 RepID=UPI0009FC59D8|nr:dodecin family protein [Henriciella litoralis]
MSVARVTEITAKGKSIDDCMEQGVKRASETLKNVEHVWVSDIKARVKDGKIDDYYVTMKVTFVLED